MNIKYKNYVIEPEGKHYNLFKEISVVVERDGKHRKAGDTYVNAVTMGYGLKFETCIEIIVKDEMADIHTTVTFNEYIKEYKRLKDETLLEINTNAV